MRRGAGEGCCVRRDARRSRRPLPRRLLLMAHEHNHDHGHSHSHAGHSHGVSADADQGKLGIALDADPRVHGRRGRRRGSRRLAGPALRRRAHAHRRGRARARARRRPTRPAPCARRDDLRPRPRRDPQRAVQRHDAGRARAADRLRGVGRLVSPARRPRRASWSSRLVGIVRQPRGDVRAREGRAGEPQRRGRYKHILTDLSRSWRPRSPAR